MKKKLMIALAALAVLSGGAFVVANTVQSESATCGCCTCVECSCETCNCCECGTKCNC